MGNDPAEVLIIIVNGKELDAAFLLVRRAMQEQMRIFSQPTESCYDVIIL